MKREEYLQELRLRLQEDDFAQVEEAIAYFNELLDDKIVEEGMAEEEAVAQMDSPQNIAVQLKEAQKQHLASAQPATPEDSFQPGMRTINAKADLVRQIVVEDRNMRLRVIGEDREDIEIKHPETEKIKYNFSLQDGRLYLQRIIINTGIFFNNFNFFGFENSGMNLVTMKVPKELASEMDLSTSNAGISMEDVGCWGNLKAKSSNGSIKLKNVSAKTIGLKTSNAPIALEKVKANLDLIANTSNGSIKANDVAAPLELKLHTSNATIQAENLNSKDFYFQTSNGNIRGSLPGRSNDYTITSSTSNGKNSLSKFDGNGPNKLCAHTSNASISLSFDETVMAHKDTQALQQASPQPDDSVEQKITSALDNLEQQINDLGDRVSHKVENRISKLMERLENMKKSSSGNNKT